jgi:hypothetical protein
MCRSQGSTQIPGDGIQRMTTKGFNKGNTGELRPSARAFLETYRAASIASAEQFSRVVKGGGGYRSFDGSAVELTEQLSTLAMTWSTRPLSCSGPKVPANDLYRL